MGRYNARMSCRRTAPKDGRTAYCMVCGVWCAADDDSSNDGQLCVSSLSLVFLFHGSSGIFLRLVAVGAKAAADWALFRLSL
eukprot:scaffold215652_cov31-Attheya_sp.AAC.1